MSRLLSTQELQSCKPTDQQVLEILLVHKVISYSILRYLLDYMEIWNADALTAIRETHLAGESRVADAFAASLKIVRIYHLSQTILATQHTSCLPFNKARQYLALLIKEDASHGEDAIELVCANPCACAHELLPEIEKRLGFKPRLAVAETREVRKAIDLLYPLNEQLPWIFTTHGLH